MRHVAVEPPVHSSFPDGSSQHLPHPLEFLAVALTRTDERRLDSIAEP